MTGRACATPGWDGPIYVRLTRAPELIGVSRQQIYRAESAGELTIHRVRGTSLVRVDEVRAWIESGADDRCRAAWRAGVRHALGVLLESDTVADARRVLIEEEMRA